jgi:altronate dehydratase large subunit
MRFQGYQRKNGTVGVRNHLLVLSTVACANGVVEAIGRELPEVMPVTHGYGCGYGPEDFRVSHRTLCGMVGHPNVGAALIIGLGCELMKAEFLSRAGEGKPVESLVIQESGGSQATTEKGLAIARKLLPQLEAVERVPVPVGELVVGLQCGGSDALSGVTANPAVGSAADRFVRAGATVVLAETTEMIGTAHILRRRGATPEIGEEVERLVNEHHAHVRAALGDLAGMVIAPGNVDGGLSSITEKSLGAITKGGTTPIQEVIEYGVRPSKRGLVIMDTPGYDVDSMAGIAAGGGQIMLFTTGRGTPAGFPAVPVVKISSNSKTFRKMPGDIDVNAGAVVDEGKTIDEVGQEIFDLTLEVAAGRRTCAERNRCAPFNYLKQGPTF